MNGSTASRTWRLGCATALAVGVLAAPAAADRVYHSEHLQLTPVNSAPLRSGFVENTKAQGPQTYAHEIYVLNGAVPNTGYTVTRDLFAFDPTCAGDLVFNSQSPRSPRTPAATRERMPSSTPPTSRASPASTASRGPSATLRARSRTGRPAPR
jgi:hypothetical protein